MGGDCGCQGKGRAPLILQKKRISEVVLVAVMKCLNEIKDETIDSKTKREDIKGFHHLDSDKQSKIINAVITECYELLAQIDQANAVELILQEMEKD